MFEALRHITTRSPAGNVIVIGPGEQVVGFESWPLTNQCAAINTHMVRRMQPGVSLTARANETQLREERERLIAEAIRRQESGEAVVPAPDAEQGTPGDEALCCEQCDYTTHSAQGLKTHKARKHR